MFPRGKENTLIHALSRAPPGKEDMDQGCWYLPEPSATGKGKMLTNPKSTEIFWYLYFNKPTFVILVGIFH